MIKEALKEAEVLTITQRTTALEMANELAKYITGNLPEEWQKAITPRNMRKIKGKLTDISCMLIADLINYHKKASKAKKASK